MNTIATIREEIAIRAARLIAEDGLDYGSAKQKAAQDVIGNRRIQSGWMPDNEAIENEVRLFQELFQSETQPQRLLELRQTALALMQWLDHFQPYLTGAVLNGTAGERSDIHLQLFVDSPKDVEIFLLNQNIDFEARETPRILGGPGNRSKMVETLSFMWQHRRSQTAEGVHLYLYETEALRNSPLTGKRKPERLDTAGVQRLLDQDLQNTHPDQEIR